MAPRPEVQLEHGWPAMHAIPAISAEMGVGGATGYVLEYTGPVIRSLSMEERMTICNMSIEAGARAGNIGPDETTDEYLSGRPHAPKGEAWDEALAYWESLPTDEGAEYDASYTIDASSLTPRITFGTNPGMGLPIGGVVPDPAGVADLSERRALERALEYMELRPGEQLAGRPVDVVFIGSCTNSRLSDLRAAAEIMRGRRVAPGVRSEEHTSELQSRGHLVCR